MQKGCQSDCWNTVTDLESGFSTWSTTLKMCEYSSMWMTFYRKLWKFIVVLHICWYTSQFGWLKGTWVDVLVKFQNCSSCWYREDFCVVKLKSQSVTEGLSKRSFAFKYCCRRIYLGNKRWPPNWEKRSPGAVRCSACNVPGAPVLVWRICPAFEDIVIVQLVWAKLVP